MKDLLMQKDNLITGPSLNSRFEKPEILIVLLHGWGSNGEDLIQLAPLFSNHLPEAHFISPNGPEVCPQNPFGGRQWFGLNINNDGSINRDDMPEKLSKASEHIVNFLNYWQNKLSINAKNTFLIGFSQGSMVTLEYGSKNKIGGLLCYSGSFINNKQPLTKDHKIMLVHGELDETIPIKSMEKAKSDLTELGANVSSHNCKNLGHSINEEGIKIGIEFIKKCNI